MAPVARRLFLVAPIACVAAAWLGSASQAGIETLDAPPLDGASHASGAAAKGFRHQQLTGWVTVIHAFASWRPECRDEIALLSEIAGDARFQLAGLVVKDSEEAARDFIARNGNPYDALAYDRDGRAARLLGVREVPSTFVLNIRGEIVHSVRGPLKREYIQQTLLPVIDAISPVTELMASRRVLVG